MKRYFSRVVVVTICFVALALIAQGQSGRKQKKPEPQPPVQGVNQPEMRTQPEQEVAPEKDKPAEPRRSMMVATSMPDVSIPLYFADTARQGFISEVRHYVQTIDLREERNQNRADAIKMAKQEDSMVVVLLELDLDRMATSYSGVELRYSIFEPRTGKAIGMGSGFPQQPSSIGVPPIGASRQQVYVDWQGRDAARQVLKRLGLIH